VEDKGTNITPSHLLASFIHGQQCTGDISNYDRRPCFIFWWINHSRGGNTSSLAARSISSGGFCTRSFIHAETPIISSSARPKSCGPQDTHLKTLQGERRGDEDDEEVTERWRVWKPLRWTPGKRQWHYRNDNGVYELTWDCCVRHHLTYALLSSFALPHVTLSFFQMSRRRSFIWEIYIIEADAFNLKRLSNEEQ